MGFAATTCSAGWLQTGSVETLVSAGRVQDVCAPQYMKVIHNVLGKSQTCHGVATTVLEVCPILQPRCPQFALQRVIPS